jgi:hypothetical protein
MIAGRDRRAIVAAALLGLVSALPAVAVADGAHEYAGEAYLMVNDLAKAEEHLGALQTIYMGGPDMAPQPPPAFGAPRQTRGAPLTPRYAHASHIRVAKASDVSTSSSSR